MIKEIVYKTKKWRKFTREREGEGEIDERHRRGCERQTHT